MTVKAALSPTNSKAYPWPTPSFSTLVRSGILQQVCHWTEGLTIKGAYHSKNGFVPIVSTIDSFALCVTGRNACEKRAELFLKDQQNTKEYFEIALGENSVVKILTRADSYRAARERFLYGITQSQIRCICYTANASHTSLKFRSLSNY